MDIEKIFNEIVGRAKVGATSLWSSDEKALIWAQEEIERVRTERDALLAEREQLLAQAVANELSGNDQCHDYGWMAGWGAGLRGDTKAMQEVKARRSSRAVPAQQVKDIEVTDQMASAFNQAICDDAMNDQDIEEVKAGLRAAISHLQPLPVSFYELEISRLTAINKSLLDNERRLLDRVRNIQPSPAVAVPNSDEGLLPIHAADHPDCQVMYWSEQELRAIKDYAKRCIAAQSPRITEQDAREIAIEYTLHRGTEYNRGYAEMFVGQFFATDEGRALLNKLNKANHETN